MTEHADRIVLMETPAFRRFLFSLIRRAGLFDAAASASDGRELVLEGRRGLAIEILRDLDEAQQVKSASGIPLVTLIQTLSEEVQSASKEKPDAARSTYADMDDEE